jgi:hypothetical protein
LDVQIVTQHIKKWSQIVAIYKKKTSQAHVGVKGLVRDSITGRPIANAAIHVQNITQDGDKPSVPKDIDHDITSGKCTF